jgi:hypothetical protein
VLVQSKRNKNQSSKTKECFSNEASCPSDLERKHRIWRCRNYRHHSMLFYLPVDRRQSIDADAFVNGSRDTRSRIESREQQGRPRRPFQSPADYQMNSISFSSRVIARPASSTLWRSRFLFASFSWTQFGISRLPEAYDVERRAVEVETGFELRWWIPTFLTNLSK